MQSFWKYLLTDSFLYSVKNLCFLHPYKSFESNFFHILQSKQRVNVAFLLTSVTRALHASLAHNLITFIAIHFPVILMV